MVSAMYCIFLHLNTLFHLDGGIGEVVSSHKLSKLAFCILRLH